MSKYAFLSLMVLTAGCGSQIDNPSGTSGAGGATSTGSNSTGNTGVGGATGAGGGEPEVSYSVDFGPVKIAPGDEDTQCVVIRLGNPALLRAGKIHNVLGGGSHHLIVYRTNDTEEKLTPFNCVPFADTLDPAKGTPLMITQKHDETLTFPKGVAVSLEPNQMLRLEMHFLNVSDKEAEVKATSTFIAIKEADFKDEAGFLFAGNPDIKIPPQASATLGPTFMKLPSKLNGVKFFGITGHTHQWGTNVLVAAADSKNGPDTPMYDVPNWQWAEPATVYQDPPIEIKDGGGFRFSCSWKNSSNKEVTFGESANAEMCFFWAYYYPSKGALVCAHTDQVPGGYDLCCPGNAFCDQIF